MYIQDKGLQYSQETARGILLDHADFKKICKGKSQQQIQELVNHITYDVVLLADCIRMQGATKTTCICLISAKETAKTTYYKLVYNSSGGGMSMFYFVDDLLSLYGAKEVKTGRGVYNCFYSSTNAWRSVDATEKLMRLVRDLTGVYCHLTELI